MSIHHPFVANAFYAKFRAPNADELHEYVENKEGPSAEFNWEKLCEVDTIKITDHEEIDKLLLPSVHQFKKDLDCNFEYELTQAWINNYRMGGYQEVHNHYFFGIDFASVFIHNDGPSFGKFFFYNLQYPMNSPTWKHIFKFPERWDAKLKPGDIIFFPSIMMHGVQVHKSDQVRKTLSANYRFRFS